MKKRIVQLGAGPLQTLSIVQLRESGLEVHALDRDPDAPGFALADGSAAVDVADAAGVEGYARRARADAIVAVNEAGVLAAAEASLALGLRNVPPDVARRALDKGEMRDAWRAAGLAQPEYRVLQGTSGLERAAAEVGYPVVVKPAMNWGSRGVSLVGAPSDLAWAAEFARAHCRNDRYVVEKAVPGTEMTVEGLVAGGRAQVLARSDKEPQPHPRYRVAMALNYPARFSASELERADRLVAAAAAALGIDDGAIHCECMVSDGEVYLVEMGARPGGGHIFSLIVEAASGVPMPRALAAILLGEPFDLRPRRTAGACYRFFAPPPGTFREARGIEEARRSEGVLDLGFQMRPGTQVGPVAGDADRPGHVVSTGATREEAMRNADRALARIHYVMAASEESPVKA